MLKPTLTVLSDTPSASALRMQRVKNSYKSRLPITGFYFNLDELSLKTQVYFLSSSFVLSLWRSLTRTLPDKSRSTTQVFLLRPTHWFILGSELHFLEHNVEVKWNNQKSLAEGKEDQTGGHSDPNPPMLPNPAHSLNSMPETGDFCEPTVHAIKQCHARGKREFQKVQMFLNSSTRQEIQLLNNVLVLCKKMG